MTDSARAESTSPGAVAWLEISPDGPPGAGRAFAGPLGLQITPLTGAGSRHAFHGGRLRGVRCVWAAATVSGAELSRPARPRPSGPGPLTDLPVQLLAKVVTAGSVFDPAIAPARGLLEVIDPWVEVDEHVIANTHLFTLSVPLAAVGLEPLTVAAMYGRYYELGPLQIHLLRSAATMLRLGGDVLTTPSRLTGVDRYLAGLAGMLLRTAVEAPAGEAEQVESIRSRVDAIIRDQVADPALSPATIASQLNTSLRQLYRAFNGSESPAARIRRRRLEQAAEILAQRPNRAHVEQVARQCGFVSAEYFSRAFRREYGVSPRAYRTAHSAERPPQPAG